MLTYTVFNLVPVLKVRIERKNGNGNGSGNGKVCQAEALTQAMTQQAQAMSQQTAILDRVSRNQEDQGKILSKLADAEVRRQQQQDIRDALRAEAARAT